MNASHKSALQSKFSDEGLTFFVTAAPVREQEEQQAENTISCVSQNFDIRQQTPAKSVVLKFIRVLSFILLLLFWSRGGLNVPQ